MKRMKTELLIAAASILPFLPSFFGNFVFDDWESIVNNPIVNGNLPLSELVYRDFWGRSLASPHSHKSFRPLTSFIFRIEWMLFKGKATGFHTVNVVLHAIVSLLIFKVFQRIEMRWKLKNSIASLAGASFAIHPIHTEAVANVTGMAELLSTFWIALGLLYFLKTSSNISIPTMSLLFIFSTAAVLSKEQGISLFPICALICLLERKMTRFFFCCIFSIFLVLFRWKIGGSEAPKFTSSDNPAAFVKDPFLRWSSFVWQWFLHLKLLLFPVEFCFDYSMGCVPPILFYADIRLFSLFLLIPFSCLLIYFSYRNLPMEHQRIFVFSILFGGITFFPASNVPVIVGFSLAERVLYLPSIGFSLLLAIFIKKMQKIGKLMDSSLCLAVILASSISFQRSIEWTTEFSLYSSGLRVCPNNPKVHYNLAKVFSEKRRIREAEKEYREALRLNPIYEQALNNLGNLLEKEGRLDEAERLLRTAVTVQPHFATAWMNLGIATMNSGKYNESLVAFEESLKKRPLSADCHFNLGNLYQKMGQLPNAIETWKAAVRVDPFHSAAWTNLLVALDENGRCSEVIRLSSSALRHVPHSAPVRTQLGVCFAQLGLHKEAELHLTEAMRLNPRHASYKANLDAFKYFKESRARNKTMPR